MSEPNKNEIEDEGSEPSTWECWVKFLSLYFLTAGWVLLFFPLKWMLTDAFDLKRRAVDWDRMQLLYRPLKWASGLCSVWLVLNCYRLFHGLFHVLPPHMFDPTTFALHLLGAVAAALVFNLMRWIQGYARDPDIRKLAAGARAERWVRSLIAKCQRALPGSLALHGALFVFHPDTVDEFSVESDHILVTRRNIFVIETKYKSGTITATAEAAKWKTAAVHGEGQMGNALKQVKNAARVLQRQLSLPCEPIPLVAIVGEDVRIVDNPTNVLAASDLALVIAAFEHMQAERIPDPSAVIALLQQHASEDKSAMQRHIERAQTAKRRNEMTEIVNAASLS